VDLIGCISSLFPTANVCLNFIVPVATNTNLLLADLLTSKIPVIYGAPPLYDSKSLKAKRVFYDSKIDHEGAVWLPNTAIMRIKQTSGGRAPVRKIVEDSDDKGLWSLSPSPAPMKLRSMVQKGVEDRDALSQRASKSTLGYKKVEVVVATTTGKLQVRGPSIITVGDTSSGSDYDSLPQQRTAKSTLGHKKVGVVVAPTTGKSQKRGPSVITVGDTSSGSDYIPEGAHVADNDGDTVGSSTSSDILIVEDEQATSTRKCKAKSQQSSRATKKVAMTLPDMNTKQRRTSKGVKSSSRKQSTKNTRHRIISPPDSNSSGQESNGNRPNRQKSSVTHGFAQDTGLMQVPMQMSPVPEEPSQEPRVSECKSSPASARNTYLINPYFSAMQSQYALSQVQVDRLGTPCTYLGRLTRPPEGENRPSVTGQRMVAQE